ncbi:14042_t:CDS:2 [Funneliformis caledonium]|uniref:14042_t:CDS:1 n=1 Tax=Funneliformis caledonium TaxID=1117310 RepID=A0A9N9EH85_9GLOM|nr:14042_t:CDS:2 [Funneliformis caledonium]
MIADEQLVSHPFGISGGKVIKLAKVIKELNSQKATIKTPKCQFCHGMIFLLMPFITLINNSEETKKRTGSNKILQSQNLFILYHRDMSARLKAESADEKIKEAKRSKEIAIRWERRESPLLRSF